MSDSTLMRDAAMRYAGEGRRIFPLYEPSPAGGCTCGKVDCKSIGKHPRIRDWQNKASADIGQNGLWWQKWPNANIAMSCDGLIVLDFDPKVGGLQTLKEWEEEYGSDLLDAPRNLTGLYPEGRGVHIRFRQAGYAVPNGTGVAKGVDVRSNGGFIVVAPSLHKSGIRYEWDAGIEPTVPLWVEEITLSRSNTKFSLEDLLRNPPTAGDRNHWMARVCGYLARTHREDFDAYEREALAAFLLINDHRDFNEAEAKAVWISIWKREHRVGRLPEINTLRTARNQAEEAWRALDASNRPPRLFRSGGQPVRLELEDSGAPTLQPLTVERMGFELSRAATWTGIRRKEWVEVNPPAVTVRQVLATPSMPLPALTRIVSSPVFGPDGTLYSEPGYHESGQILYVPDRNFTFEIPPERPSEFDLTNARKFFGELLCDFPFESNSDRAHAISLLILPLARDLIVGPTPLHLIGKPAPGTGASLLAEALLFPAIGAPPGSMSDCKDEDEWRKRITAAIRSGPMAILLDNLSGRLSSSSLSAALTQSIWEDRILGQTQIGRWPIRNVWVATANNLQLSTDIARRTVWIRLDSHSVQPWLGRSFSNELPSWTVEHRSELVWSGLCVVRKWLSLGRPLGTRSLGSYGAWAKAMGGMMEVLGEEGFLDDFTQRYEDSDSDAMASQWFVEAWWDNFHDGWIKTSDLFSLTFDQDFPIDLGTSDNRSARIRLGKYLQSIRDRYFRLENGKYVQIERSLNKNKGVPKWRLKSHP